MFENIVHSISLLNAQLILLSAILFMLGLLLTDFVLERNFRWLIAYPVWIYKKIENWMDRFSNRFLIFLFIVVFNMINLFFGFISGFLVIAPFILAVWTGLNIGIVMRQSIGEGGFWLIFLNPVALFELPAAWISLSLGIEMGMDYLIGRPYQTLILVFHEKYWIFVWLVIPLLVIAGVIESAMIHYLKKQLHDSREE